MTQYYIFVHIYKDVETFIVLEKIVREAEFELTF